ncbi:DEAD/DEAH box helicase [Frankia sp. AgB32]|uniref:DEAD/DEAH box helicase n=1 Tax=Frankia sp. AgB32 TaxID=631119 RepID=UPI00200CCAA1|nr:DEAD/DEAH box helicase [Frankia sp. AgB32]MCK9893997.1 DEAD/DEAH box helicase [Frankia sp. AgB32]
MAVVAAAGTDQTLVLHALVGPDGPLLWAEDATRLPSAPAGAQHPFAASAAVLRQRVVGLGDAADDDTAEVVLPSGAAGPLRSPELAALVAGDERWAGPGAGGGPAVLRRWQVPVVRPRPSAGFAALARGGSGPRPGATLRYLAVVGDVAADLVTRGRLLPDVHLTADGPRARWTPVLTGPDVTLLDTLRDAMPPAFRATPGAARTAMTAMIGMGADEALRGTLAAMVDAVARDRLGAAGRPLRPPSSARKSVAGRWVIALGGEAGFTGPGAATRDLADRVGHWRARAAAAAPVRACFRLHEPADAADPLARWRVEFLLRPGADQSLLVGADRIWDGRADRLPVWPEHPQDILLTALGRAGAIWPGVRRALGRAQPTGVDLDVTEAHEFLQVAGELERAGFVVLVPAWWRRRVPVRLALSARVANPVVPTVRDTAMSLDELVDFRWDVSLGGQRLSRAELTDLAAAKVPLVQVRGRWTLVDPAVLAAGLARTAEAGRMTVRAALAHAGLAAQPAGHEPPAQRGPSDLEVEVSADGWLGGLLAGPGGDQDPDAADDLIEFVEPPAGLGVALRPYQRRGLAWLVFLDRVGVGALLADDMGLGKTVQVLALELVTRESGPRPPTLVVCPMSVVGHWADEAARAAPDLRVHVHHGADRPGGAAFAALAADHDLIVTTYALVRRDAAELGGLVWDRIVLDEAQQIKNSGTQLARAVRALPARHRVALTGTPVENRLADLWSIMHFLNPGLLGGSARFRARYAVPIERYDDTDAVDRLRRRIRPVVLRRVKTNPAVLADLPPKIERRDLCPLTPEQASLYQAVLDDMLERLADYSPVRRRGAVLAAMTKLKQVCNHPAHLLGDASSLPGRSGKLARVEEVLDQIVADGERALCFTQFARFGAMLEPYLRERFGVEVTFLHGGTPRRERDAMVERFQRGRGPGIFLLSLRAGGTGLNLTAASHVLHLDRWWNPAAEAQATDRAYRIGQRRGVQVRTFVCMGTLEERVDRMLADKTLLARTMIGDGESWLAALSTDELRDLCALSPGTVDV